MIVVCLVKEKKLAFALQKKTTRPSNDSGDKIISFTLSLSFWRRNFNQLFSNDCMVGSYCGLLPSFSVPW
jgi:hypothetical protein